MPKINLLSEEIINKIAAGEVIERPASVVKELIENALDAKATKITIELEDSGKKLIRISDNGEGMDEEDARNSIIRHATSKIKSSDDLFSINTLGFRGEALASIAAVSQLSIITKQQQELAGFNLVVEAGNSISSGSIAAEQGTTIEVQNLFFNTPARKKFLKTDAVELRHIVDPVIRYALINPTINLKLTHEGHTLLNAPAVDNLRDNILSIYGLSLAKDLLEIHFQQDTIKITGYIAKPYHARNDKSQQSLFVNKRWVRNEDISKAIYDAYHSLLFVNKHPIFVLNLEIDPQKIDVNIHPSKLDVKFDQAELIYNVVFNAVRETLQKNNLIPQIDLEQEQGVTFGYSSKRTKYSFEPSTQTVFQVREPAALIIKDANLEAEKEEESEQIFKEQIIENGITTKIANKLPPMRLLGQIHKTFFIAEAEGGVLYIDQHAAHERVLYEKFMNQYFTNNIKNQQLLQGEVIEFSPTEKALILDNHLTLQKFGFHVELFGENSFLLTTIPAVFNRLQPKESLFEFLGTLQETKNSLEKIEETIISRMACRAAVMAGEELTNQQMESILKELTTVEHPFSCAHGRPTIIRTESYELEKKFRRC